MQFFKKRPVYLLLAALAFILLWHLVGDQKAKPHTLSNNNDSPIAAVIVSPKRAQNTRSHPTQLSHRITEELALGGKAIPKLPDIIAKANKFPEEELQQLAHEWLLLKEQRTKQRNIFYSSSGAKEAERLELIYQGVSENNYWAFEALNIKKNHCEFIKYESSGCEHFKLWFTKQKQQDENFSIFSKIEALAIAGDLNAQHAYYYRLMQAVGEGDVNTARDISQWLERRDRAIAYLIKFAKLGDWAGMFMLGEMFEGNFLIKAKPFWAAVFYRQPCVQAARCYLYEHLLELHGLDEELVEKARQQFFES